MTIPKRIQRKRTKGWRLPPNTVCVSRPGIYGNPWSGRNAVQAFRDWLETGKLYWASFEGLCGKDPTMGPCALNNVGEMDLRRQVLLTKLPELRGKDLACWCGDGPCHADVLLMIANQEPKL